MSGENDVVGISCSGIGCLLVVFVVAVVAAVGWRVGMWLF